MTTLRMTDTQFNNLPKYAQDEIRALRNKLAEVQAIVKQTNPNDAKVVLCGLGMENDLGLPDTGVRFKLARRTRNGNVVFNDWIEVRRVNLKEGGLNIYSSSGPLKVTMKVSNNFMLDIDNSDIYL